MTRLLLLAALLAAPGSASAADRSVGIGSFDRVRIDGPFIVTVVTGQSPGARISGDRDVIADVEVRSDGGTVFVRRTINGTWGEHGTATATMPVTVTLTTPMLSSVQVLGSAKVGITRMTAPRVDLSLAGPGSIAVDAADTADLRMQLIGTGTLAIGGKAVAARMTSNGSGTIDAAKLEANDLLVGLDGLGQISARARYSARITSGGLGTVTVTGHPKCFVKAIAGAPVTCGDPTPSSAR